MAIDLILFSGSECSLCDLAKDLLEQVAEQCPYSLTTIDVKAERQYYHQYGARIPVVFREDTQSELGWPFDKAQLLEFLK
ncbi:glutaredoxin family protein [Paraneptunicella aestuarii]|uniref:glutaredoxin family protein n=1 Tax=Paraneptunicella aestuarii TaxID=2831148 RepID=UPI001E4F4811|nr:glutaredoxin family protein [Paraneptunicella aestuarii]